MSIRYHAFLSTIDDAPVSWFVYSAFSFYGPHRGYRLPGRWLVDALATVGRNEPAVRQTLYRMERDGELIAERAGRSKIYTPSAYARAEIEAGTAKLLRPAPMEWDGSWTIVHLRLRATQEVHRQRILAMLQVEGFGMLDRDTYVHPHPVGARVQNALHPSVRAHVVIMRGVPLAELPMQHTVSDLWNVGEIASRYRQIVRAFTSLENALHQHRCSDREAFLLRFAVVFRHLQVAWDDPELPPTVLPADWPGDAARAGAAVLYQRLLPGAVRYANSLMKTARTH